MKDMSHMTLEDSVGVQKDIKNYSVKLIIENIIFQKTNYPILINKSYEFNRIQGLEIRHLVKYSDEYSAENLITQEQKLLNIKSKL